MEDIDKWKELYESGLSFDKIAAMFGCSYKKVRGRLLKVGLKPRVMSKPFSEEQIQDVLTRYQNKESAQRIAKDYGVTIKRIKNIVISKGVFWDNLPTNYKLKSGCQINRDCFKNFTTEQEMYFFGLLLADGCIVSDSNKVQICLQTRDVNILEKFKQFLGSDLTIRKKSNQEAFLLSFSDKVIADKLRGVGLESAKSLREKLPTFYDSNSLEMRHFWRGFVDGDGSVRSLASYRARGFGLIGTLELVSSFEKFCRKFANTSEKQYFQNKTVNKNCYEIQFTGIDASAIANLLYSDCSVSLDRKQEQADHLINMVGVKRPFPRRKKKVTN